MWFLIWAFCFLCTIPQMCLNRGLKVVHDRPVPVYRFGYTPPLSKRKMLDIGALLG